MHARSLLRAIALIVVCVGGVACGSAQPVTQNDRVLSSCAGCHGGQDNWTGAPPTDTRGRSDPSLPSVGAHTAHVQAGALATAIDCDACHPKPAAFDSPGHMDGKVQIVFGARATAGGAVATRYDASTTRCANVYCHGGFLGGNQWNVPVWTAGASQAACGSCHGDPLATASALPRADRILASGRAHPRLAPGATNATCNVCHPATVKADGTIDVAGGKHADGAPQIDAAAVHPAGWLDWASRDFHLLQFSADCWRCHSLNPPAHVTTVVCNDCHVAIGHPLTLQ
jgi:predicted CxxxxCH...CXXCH cytochrome family protein